MDLKMTPGKIAAQYVSYPSYLHRSHPSVGVGG